MTRPGFLNDNEFRSYPFIHGREAQIPDCIVVDFGSTALAGSGYIEGLHEVWLEWIRKIGDTLEFSFRSDAPGLVDQALIFQRDISDSDYLTTFSYAQTALTEEQLEEACECGPNLVCNHSFSETVEEYEEIPSSVSDYLPDCDRYPGSPVFAWSVPDGVTQDGDVLNIEVSPLGIKEVYQQVDGFFPGQHIKVFFDLVAHDGSTTSPVVVSINGPDKSTVITQFSTTEAGTHQLTADVPAGGTIYIVIKAFNTSASATLHVQLDDVTAQACISNSSSFSAGVPDPELCPTDSVWEGFMVTGDVECILEFLEDCTRLAGTPGGEGDVDVLFMTDTTGSMGRYIATIKSVFSPLANNVVAQLPLVTFSWGAASYRDFEDGGPYASGVSLDQTFTTDISIVETAIRGWSASGGGDLPEQNLAALKLAAERWLAWGGRPDSQKVIIWGGDIHGWDNGAKGLPYPSLAATIGALTTLGVKVFGINSRGAGKGLDDQGQASLIAAATGGILSNNVGQDDADTIAALVAQHVLTAGTVPGEAKVNLFEGPAYVEPSRTKNLDGSYVRSLAVTNADRTRATSPDGCRELCWPFELEEHCLICECVAQHIRFKEGYNSNIRVDRNDNSIIIDAELGAGDGSSCEQIVSCHTEAPPTIGATLDGAPTCLDVVRSINGSGRRYFEIHGGDGIQVTAVPEQHRIIIDVSLVNLALCPDLPDDEPVTCFADSSDPCDCGPEGDVIPCPEGATTSAPTTTTSDPSCGGPCVYSWSHPLGESEGNWVKISGECEEGCDCSEPSTDGLFHGEQRNSPCVTDTTVTCLLTNPEFGQNTIGPANSIVALPGWDWKDIDPDTGARGASPIVPGGFALWPIKNQGFVIRLLSTEGGGNVRLKQNVSVTSNKIYRVTAYLSNPQGRARWGVSTSSTRFDATTILPPFNETFLPNVPGDYGRFEVFEIGVPDGIDQVTVFFEADKFLAHDGRGVLDVAGVCIEAV